MTRKKAQTNNSKISLSLFGGPARTNCAYSFPQKWQIEAKTPFPDKCAHGSRSIFRLRFPAKFSHSQPFAIRDSPIACQLDENRDDERRSTDYPRAFEAPVRTNFRDRKTGVTRSIFLSTAVWFLSASSEKKPARRGSSIGRSHDRRPIGERCSRRLRWLTFERSRPSVVDRARPVARAPTASIDDRKLARQVCAIASNPVSRVRNPPARRSGALG